MSHHRLTCHRRVSLDLWLATMNSGLSFGRLSIGSSARALGLADPGPGRACTTAAPSSV
ncbi:hypothetical protein OG416_38080 (plasmid) [Streptomyces longwoodensis]|uniref:Uncharacterized protein n=1 Tax=Streptomyces liliifuscus TaxID=2797636 RepID=A0A7T7RI60_9ACTN|nr:MULTISPECIES: hypothetical protein [Streptomyces]MCX5173944.1 hypothetical protein [Streptomyces antibioticus]QQM47490.1 hypothetical protein JEQ17_48905 [Streptomyces liliifuscus]WUC76634.1 hypothetical protein OG416_38080 [Streptomyces longwoodensis]